MADAVADTVDRGARREEIQKNAKRKILADGMRKRQEDEAAKAKPATDPVPTAKPTPMQEKKERVLGPGRCQLTEFLRASHTITVEEGTSLEDMLEPGFWGLHASKFKAYDEIEFRCDDGSMYGKLLVLVADRAWAKVFPLSAYRLNMRELQMEELVKKFDKYEIKHRGPHLQWCVIRKSDAKPVKEGMPTEDEARVALRALVQQAGAAV